LTPSLVLVALISYSLRLVSEKIVFRACEAQ
jgi:hypothetical protein